MFSKTVDSVWAPAAYDGASGRNRVRGVQEVRTFAIFLPCLQSGLAISKFLSFHYTTNRKVDIAMKGLKVSRLLALLLVLGLPAVMVAQSSNAIIQGTITDSTGAVVSGATIDVTSTATGQTVNAVSGGAGDYAVNALKPGAYIGSGEGFELCIGHAGCNPPDRPGTAAEFLAEGRRSHRKRRGND